MLGTGAETWLKCDVEDGMLPGEYAVEIQTLDTGKVSLFAQSDKVRVDSSLIRVDVVQDDDAPYVFVYLPAQPFEISFRIVRVPRDLLVTLQP